ncbi:MAG: aminotransferase class V-fold PLP-dependent enzyme [Candidatus Shikimatogenerans bostrichidophilus]|nr:MAG: aminotransferase class V-fold PLP-dependent enzyme [Candidatus Shikimatogenerans bostrichidophilus]
MLNKKEIKKIRLNFPILYNKKFNNKIIYLDNASTTQKPKNLINSIKYYYYNYNSNINRYNNNLSNKTTILINKTRNYIKKFINAKSKNEIIFTKNTTESINLISNSLKFTKNNEIIITYLEHHSNILPWLKLKKIKKIKKINIININKKYNISLKDISKKLNKNTRLISITHISNVFGTILPIKNIVKTIKRFNKQILILLDGAQSIGHIPIDVQELNIDYFVFSAHKIYGPTGLGILYGKKKKLKILKKYQLGGNMVKDVNLKRRLYLKIPNKFEAGTPNISSIISFYSVLKYLNKINLYNIYLYEKKILDYIKYKLLKINKIILYGTDKINNSSILSFNIKNINSFDVGYILNNYGIYVRTGYHCAQPLFNKLNIKQGSIRISLGIYNNYNEIDKFIYYLLKIIN